MGLHPFFLFGAAPDLHHFAMMFVICLETGHGLCETRGILPLLIVVKSSTVNRQQDQKRGSSKKKIIAVSEK